MVLQPQHQGPLCPHTGETTPLFQTLSTALVLQTQQTPSVPEPQAFLLPVCSKSQMPLPRGRKPVPVDLLLYFTLPLKPSFPSAEGNEYLNVTTHHPEDRRGFFSKECVFGSRDLGGLPLSVHIHGHHLAWASSLHLACTVLEHHAQPEVTVLTQGDASESPLWLSRHPPGLQGARGIPPGGGAPSTPHHHLLLCTCPGDRIVPLDLQGET